MTDILDNEDENAAKRKKTDGEGDAGAGNAISRMLTTKKAQQVKGEHRRLIDSDLVEALVEFCADGIMRASAQAEVVWNKTFTVVTNFITFCQKELPALAKNLQRTAAARDSRTMQKQKGPGNNLGMSFGPTGPTE